MVQSQARSHGWRLVVLQIAGAMLLMLCSVFAPPAQGNFLLVPIRSDAAVAAAALDNGALIVGRGPAGVSLVVKGRRALLAAPLLKRGILTLGAPALLCGESSAT